MRAEGIERWLGVMLTVAAVLACNDIPGLGASTDESKSSDDDGDADDEKAEGDDGDGTDEGDGTAEASADSYGAIAWSEKNKRWYVAARKASSAAAAEAAMAGCGRPDCKVKGKFGPGQCIAVAHGQGGVASWGWKDSRTAARNRALDECKERGSGCSLQKTVCNDGPPIAEAAGADDHAASSVASTEYATDGFDIPDNCASAVAVLGTAPTSKIVPGAPWNWPFAVQALYAHNREFVVGAPDTTAGARAGRIVPVTYPAKGSTDARHLVVTCAHGGQCKKLAAMYRAVVPKAKPQVMCGKNALSNVVDTSHGFRGVSWDDPPSLVREAQKKLRNHVGSQCARLGVCSRKAAGKPPDIAFECRKAPANHPIQCAKKKTCAEVVACMGG